MAGDNHGTKTQEEPQAEEIFGQQRAEKNAETTEQLRGEIAELKAQDESDRIDFRLRLAGVRNVKAVRAILTNHGGNVGTLKEAEP